MIFLFYRSHSINFIDHIQSILLIVKTFKHNYSIFVIFYLTTKIFTRNNLYGRIMFAGSENLYKYLQELFHSNCVLS
jgi:hypothetical protein